MVSGSGGDMEAGRCARSAATDVGTAAGSELFTAFDVYGYPVCRPCYEYERKDGTQACPQCKTKYKRHKGSPPARGDKSEDVDVDDASDLNYPPSGNQDQKHKIPEKMLTWRIHPGICDDVCHANKYGSSEIGLCKYDSGEIPHGYIPSFTHSQVSGEIPGASPDHMMSPAENVGKHGHPFAYVNHSSNPSREFSGSLGNVAWKES